MSLTDSNDPTDRAAVAAPAARLRITLTSDVQTHAIDDNDALVCEACGHELIGARATAFLLSYRALVPHAEMCSGFVVIGYTKPEHIVALT
jgi:hypothetical protein